MPAELAALQHWMWQVITDPEAGTTGGGASAAVARFESDRLEHVVTGSTALTAGERLEIYQQGYLRRLVNCLAELLPVLRHALGAELFELFAIEYLRHHPPRSYTLAELDRNFVRYLSEHRPDRQQAEADREDWPDFMIDLATLERDIRVTYDGPGVEGERLLSPSEIDGWSDEALLLARLEPVPCLTLRTFRFPARRYLLAVRRGEDPPLPFAERSQVALTRRDFVVRAIELGRPQHEFLSAIVGGHAVASAMKQSDVSAVPRARGWLMRFAESGLFRHPDRRIRRAPEPKEGTP